MTPNPGGIPRGRDGVDEFIVEALMIPFAMVMLDKLRECPAEMTFS